jgi:hypothetical protein
MKNINSKVESAETHRLGSFEIEDDMEKIVIPSLLEITEQTEYSPIQNSNESYRL